jgi:hypothetical protein
MVCEKADQVQEESSLLQLGIITGTRSGGLSIVKVADKRICSNV